MVDKKKYTYGLGRRKSATASARLYKGKGDIKINDKPALEYLSGNKTYLAEITDPLALAEKQKEYDITILVKGGGLAGQVDAIKLAISKALVTEAPDLRPVLKKAGFKMAFAGGSRKAKPGDDMFQIPRYELSNSTSINYFKNIVN